MDDLISREALAPNWHPRRMTIDLLSPEEKAIRDALILVEKLPWSRKLTRVSTMLVHAQDLLADCIEWINTDSDLSWRYDPHPKSSLDSIPSVNNWISVEEKLPEYWVEVLWYDWTYQEIVELWKHDDWDYFVDCTENMEKKVTHWQPLPNLPTK